MKKKLNGPKIRFKGLLLTGVFLLVMLGSCFYFHYDFRAVTGALYKKRILLYLFPAALAVVCSQIRFRIPQRWHAAARALFVLVMVVVSTVAFQSLCWNDLWDDLRFPMHTPCIPVTLSLTAVVFAALWLIIWDSRRAALVMYWLMGVLGYLYNCLWRLRGVSFSLTDLLTLETGLSVAKNYSYALQSEQMFWIGCGVLLWTLSRWAPVKKVRTPGMRLSKLGFLALACAWVMCLLTTPLLDKLNVQHNAWNQMARNYTSTQGVLTTLMKEAQNLSKLKPDHYGKKAVESIDASLLDGSLTEARGEYPNVIAVVCESMTDYGSLWQLETSQDPLPFIHSLRGKAVTGNLYVSSFGGETCNTEHSFLTGTIPAPNVPLPLLTTLRPQTPSLVSHLKNLGYKTVGIHPENPVNYQRNFYYPLLGMDSFLHIGDFQSPDVEWIHGYVSDRACYERIIRIYEEKAEGEKLFAYLMTMQNHSDYFRGNAGNVIRFISGTQDPKMEEYLNCVYQSDLALAQLCSYFEKETEPTVIVFFGDHHPKVDMVGSALRPELSETEKVYADYITPFVIWANYPIEAEHVEALSVNYLSSLLLEKAGLPMTQYDRWLLETAEKYPVVIRHGYADAEGSTALWDKQQQNWPLELQQLNLLRHNRLYDAENRLPALDIPK